jgi:hypothetical protein
MAGFFGLSAAYLFFRAGDEISKPDFRRGRNATVDGVWLMLGACLTIGVIVFAFMFRVPSSDQGEPYPMRTGSWSAYSPLVTNQPLRLTNASPRVTVTNLPRR